MGMTTMTSSPRTRFARVIASEVTASTRTVAGRLAIAQAEVDALTLDQCVTGHTAFTSFQDLLDSRLTSGYRPSLHTGIRGTAGWRLRRTVMARRIADAYDAAMEALGDDRRAYRGV